MKPKTVRIIAGIMAGIMLLTLLLPLFVFKAETAEEEYNRLQRELNAIQTELSEIRSSKTKQTEVAEAAKKQVAIIEAQISALARAIQETEEMLAEKEEQLALKKTQLFETEELFKQRLRAMYMMRGTSALATLLSVDSFSEYLTANETLRRVSVADTELLKRIEAEKQEIEKAEEEILATLKELEKEQAAMEVKRKEYAEKLQAANATISSLEAERQATQQVYDATFQQYLAAKAQVENEFTGSDGEYVGGEWMWPVPGYYGRSYVSSPYGYRTWDNGYTEFHNGIDIARGPQGSIQGAAIVASNAGYVLRAKYNAGGYGYYVMIDHGGGVYSLYGHCSSYIVSVGQYVAQGQTIAYVGSTGRSTGPHLHFEIRMNGSTVNPAPLLGIG